MSEHNSQGYLVQTPRGFDISGSMCGPGEEVEPLPDFFGVRCDGGTVPDFASIMSEVAARLPDSEFDRYRLIVTDGEPPASFNESHGDVLPLLVCAGGPFEFICLDESGARSSPCGSPRVVEGDGLLPVPPASELVARICDTVDGEAQPARTDQCCGCGGCGKK